MLRSISTKQIKLMDKKFHQLVSSEPLAYSELTPSKVPEKPGVYVITAWIDGKEFPYYVGRTKNLRQRLYKNHLMGSLSNARLKKHLITSGECEDVGSAKQFIRSFCAARWLIQEGFRERGALEGYVTALLYPKHGIYEEH